MTYGIELVLDLYGCNPEKINRIDIEQWLTELCDLIDMKREDLHFWDYTGFPEEKAKAPPHLKGTTAVQFITTSNVLIHALDAGECYVNIFTCKDFNPLDAVLFTAKWFGSESYDFHVLQRGRRSEVSV